MSTIEKMWCECCQAHSLFIKEDPHSDDLNPWPWYDIVCKECHFVIASGHIEEVRP